MNIKVKKLNPNAVLPRYQTPGSAGADLSACIDAPVTLAPGETAVIGTGFAAEIPDGYVGLVFARSGMATKRGIAPANKVGVVDSDYRGEFLVPLHNHGAQPDTIQPGERIAQLVIVPVLQANFTETDELDDTIRGGGGFGSTNS
jgi:dUTP pyrophosphatase